MEKTEEINDISKKLKDQNEKDKKYVLIDNLDDVLVAKKKNLEEDNIIIKKTVATCKKAKLRELTDSYYSRETDIEQYIKRNRLVDLFFKYIFGEKK